MLRLSRLVMVLVVAMFVVAAPQAVAQTPVTDQYSVPPGDDSGNAPAGDSGGNAPAEDSGGNAPVEVETSHAATGTLPFTGGQIALIAIIGLALLALGTISRAALRARGSQPT